MKLKEIRDRQGISMKKLSNASGVPVRTIEDIEKKGVNADCRVSTAKKLSKALNVTLDSLCDE